MNCTIFTTLAWNWALLYWQSPFLFSFLIVIRITLMAQTVKSPFTKRETQVRSWGSFSWRMQWLPTAEFLPGEFHGQRSLEGYNGMGFENSLGTTEQVQHSFIRHYSEPSLCQTQRPYIIIISRQQNPYSKEIRLRVSRRRKHGVRGLGTRDWKLAFPGAGAGKGANLGGGDSENICITSMHCTQYSFNLLFQFIIISFKHSILKNEPSFT